MIWPFLIHCIIILFFALNCKHGFWSAAFQPIYPLSSSLAPPHNRDASHLSYPYRTPKDHRRFTLTSTSDNIDLYLNLQNKWLQKLRDPFDRWRFLQKLLDDDINDADDILFILQSCIQQRYLQQQSTPSPLVSIQKSRNTTSGMASSETNLTDAPSTLSLDDTKGSMVELLETMDCILQENYVETIHRLIQSTETSGVPGTVCTPQDFRFLNQLERLLPDPSMDEDAAKGLWDTVIELHGRESVRINEKQNTMNWRTRCLIARILIFFDFLSAGLRPTNLSTQQ